MGSVYNLAWKCCLRQAVSCNCACYSRNIMFVFCKITTIKKLLYRKFHTTKVWKTATFYHKSSYHDGMQSYYGFFSLRMEVK